MKKWIVILLALLISFSLAACGKENVGGDEEVSVDTTTEETTESSSEEVVAVETDVVESTTPPTKTPTDVPTSEPTEVPTETPTEQSTPEPYTYTELNEVMYAKQSVNVRSIPNAEGEKLGVLAQNDEVHVTGQCVETSWYRIKYNDGIGYVSNNYLISEKVVESANNSMGTVEPEPASGNYATPVTAPTSTYHAGDGSDIVFTGTITLPYTNITVPTLNQFNYFPLNIEGYNSEGANEFDKRFYQVYSDYQPQIDAIFQERGAISKDLGYIITDENGKHRVSLTYGLLKSGWDAHGNAIHNWYDISIRKREPREGLPFNYYLLDINNPLKWTEQSRMVKEWPDTYNDAYMAAGYDALLYLLTFYTSTPETVAQGVMDMIYGETLYDPWEWYAFGDCLIRFHYADYVEDEFQLNIVGNY